MTVKHSNEYAQVSIQESTGRVGWTQLRLEGWPIVQTIATKPELGTVNSVSTYSPIIKQYEYLHSTAGTISVTHQLTNPGLALAHPITMPPTDKVIDSEWLTKQLPHPESTNNLPGTPQFCDLPTILQILRFINLNNNQPGMENLRGDLNNKTFVTISPDATNAHLVTVYYGPGPRGLGLFFHVEEKKFEEISNPNRNYYAPLA